MKNVKELQAIVTGILVLNSAAEQPSAEIDALCEYAFQRCFEAPTKLIRMATQDFTYEEVVDQVAGLMKAATKFKKDHK